MERDLARRTDEARGAVPAFPGIGCPQSLAGPIQRLVGAKAAFGRSVRIFRTGRIRLYRATNWIVASLPRWDLSDGKPSCRPDQPYDGISLQCARTGRKIPSTFGEPGNVRNEVCTCSIADFRRNYYRQGLMRHYGDALAKRGTIKLWLQSWSASEWQVLKRMPKG